MRFQIDSRDQIRITNEIEARGEEIAAIYHSHPNSEAAPVADRRQPRPLAGPGLLWVICSLADDEPVVRAFAIDGGRGRGGRARCRVSRRRAVEPLACPTCARKYPLERALLRRLRDAARLRRPRRAGADHRGARAGPQGEAPVHRRRAGEGRLRAQPRRGPADPGDPARGGDPELRAPQPRLRRPRLPRRRPARHPRPRRRRRGGARAARRTPASTRSSPATAGRRSARCACWPGSWSRSRSRRLLVWLVSRSSR